MATSHSLHALLLLCCSLVLIFRPADSFSYDGLPDYCDNLSVEECWSRYLHSTRWIALDEKNVTASLAAADGFKILSAALEQLGLQHLIRVDKIFLERDQTKIFIPTCDGISIYLRPLHNEKAILENEPQIVEYIRTGKLYVNIICTEIERFQDGGNISSSDFLPPVYSDVDVSVRQVDGFGSLRFPQGPRIFSIDDDEDEWLRRLMMETVIVANIVPNQPSFEFSSYEWDIMIEVYGERVGVALEDSRRRYMPYPTATLCTLYMTHS